MFGETIGRIICTGGLVLGIGSCFGEEVTEKAERRLEEIAKTEAPIYFRQGVESYNRKDYADAEKNWKKVLEIEPENINASFNLGVLYAKSKRIDEAISTMKEFTGKHPFDVKGYLILARAFEEKKDTEKSLDNILSALELDPGNGPGKRMLDKIFNNPDLKLEALKKLKAKSSAMKALKELCPLAHKGFQHYALLKDEGKDVSPYEEENPGWLSFYEGMHELKRLSSRVGWIEYTILRLRAAEKGELGEFDSTKVKYYEEDHPLAKKAYTVQTKEFVFDEITRFPEYKKEVFYDFLSGYPHFAEYVALKMGANKRDGETEEQRMMQVRLYEAFNREFEPVFNSMVKKRKAGEYVPLPELGE